MTEIILYRANLVTNGKFANITFGYGWGYTGNWTKFDGYITKKNNAAGILSQSDILIKGVQYRLTFTVTGRTSGTCSVKSLSGGSTHQSVTVNQKYEIEFYSEGTDILFDCDTTFNGSIQSVTLVPIPSEFSLDLNGTETMPFNFNIDDIFNLQARKTAWTKTIEIPGSKANNKAFGHIYKVNSEGIFDSRKKARVVIKGRGMVVFEGVASLDKIRKFPGGAVSYLISAVGESFSIFDKLANKTIKDLDFSAYDHEFNLSTIKANWGTLSTGGIYTQSIGYCTNGSYTPTLAQQTVSYTAPAITAIGTHSIDSINRVKITFASNHSFAVGDEITIDVANNLMSGTHVVVAVPSSDSIALHMAYANLTSTLVPGTTSVTKRTWVGKGYFYPLQDNGHYQKVFTSGTLYQSVYYTCKSLKGADDFSNIAKDPLTLAPIAVADGVTFVADDGMSAPMASIAPTSWTYASEITAHWIPSEGATLESKSLTINRWHPNDLIPHIFVYEVWLKMLALIDYDVSCDIVDEQFFKRLVMPCDMKFDIEATLGSPVPVVNMNTWLPAMKLSDFFSSILNMFNLVIIEDKDVRNRISLISRNTFYDDGDQKEWELHVGEAIEIEPPKAALPKYFHLRYGDSQDFYNTDYNLEIGDITNTSGIANEINRKYGDYYQSSGNEYSGKDNTVKLSFVPTVMAGPMADYYSNSDKTISVTYSADVDGTNIQRKGAFRILLAGFRGTDDAWSFTSWEYSTEEENDVVWPNNIVRIFPYAAHIDNVFDGIPHRDLNFGTLLGQYFPYTYDQELWEGNTLKGKYFSRYLNYILDRNCRYVRGTFKLSVKDIYDIDFRDEIRPSGTDFVLRLQKVLDWDLNGSGLCRCEFLTKSG
jgi:hypothetical protein